MLVLENVSKTINNIKVLEQISFTVDEKSILGLVGPNGAGKTTLIRTILSLIMQDQGSIKVNGAPHDTMEARKLIGYMPESSCLFENFTAYENLYHHLRLRGEAPSKADSRAYEMIEEFGLSRHANKKVYKLSKGLKQRVALARALSHNPSIMILDEPYSGLDYDSKLYLTRKMSQLKGQGKTILLSAHELDQAKIVCDRVVFMKKAVMEIKDYDAKKNADTVQIIAAIPNDEVINCLESLPYVARIDRIAEGIMIDFHQEMEHFNELIQLMIDASCEIKYIQKFGELEVVYQNVFGKEE